MTLDDLYSLPDDAYSHELQGGLLLAEPRPGTRHGLVLSGIVATLDELVCDGGLGVVLTGDTAFVLARSPDAVRGPELLSPRRFEGDDVLDGGAVLPGFSIRVEELVRA